MQTTSTLACLLCAALLSACATTSSNAPPASSVAAYRDSIELSGRLQANYQKDGKPESVSGKFVWTQLPGKVDISLASPLGQTLARITVTPQSATLVQADQAPRVAADIDSLTAQTLGWQLPVSGLRDWLQGYATDAAGKRFVASPANNTVLTQDGWRLRFVSWQDASGAHPAPKRIDAERNTSASADQLEIRIVLDAQG
jgi:outer membrane lipoprotein LolB